MWAPVAEEANMRSDPGASGFRSRIMPPRFAARHEAFTHTRVGAPIPPPPNVTFRNLRLCTVSNTSGWALARGRVSKVSAMKCCNVEPIFFFFLVSIRSDREMLVNVKFVLSFPNLTFIIH